MHVLMRLAGLQSALREINRKLIGYAPASLSDPIICWLKEERDVLESIPYVAQELIGHAGDRTFARVEALASRILDRARATAVDQPVERMLTRTDVDQIAPAELRLLLNLLQFAFLEDLTARLTSLLDTPAPSSTAAALPELKTIAARIRGLASANWDDLRWCRHAADAILRRDSAGTYAMSDDDTRVAIFAAIEEMAAWSGKDGVTVAETAVAMSDASHGTTRRDAAYFLIGDGTERLESELCCRVPLRRRCSRLIRRFAAATYLVPVLILAAGLVIVCALFLRHAGVSGANTTLLVAGIVLPCLAMSVDIINLMVSIVLYPPKTLPRLRFRHGVPDEYRSLVVIPVILHSFDDIEAILDTMETNYLSNRDANIWFAPLTDFPDAPQQHMPGDTTLFEAMADGVRRLNARYGSVKETPFYLLHRDREWNDSEGAWIGWERKRGKLLELNQIVLEGRSRGSTVRVGDAEALRTVRYVIALDDGTRLPMNAATRLIATLAHPLNVPVLNSDGSVTRGFTMIQPRIGKWSGARSASRFTLRINQPNTALDNLQDIHHLLFGASLYCGKAIYDVQAFDASLRGRLPENAVLSHDHLEGMYGRVGVALDVVVSDHAPPNVPMQMRQAHRWMRGDWQTLPWLFPRVPSESGRWVPSRFTLIDRWRIVENLRSSLLPVATAGSFALGWLLIPNHALAWTLAVLVIYGHQVILIPGKGPARAALGKISWRGVGGEAMHRFREQARRLSVSLMFLIYQASFAADAIGRTVYRLAVSRRNLLEWTAAAQAARSIRMTSAFMFWEMRGSILLTAAVGAALWLRSPQSLPVAAPFLILWLLSPQLAYWTGRRAGEETRSD